MKIRNKILSGLMTVALLTTAFAGTAFAEESTSYANGTGTATITMCKDGSTSSESMCNSIFCHTADVTLTDDNAIITFYVAYPIPAYSDSGTDGTLLDVVATYNEVNYTAHLDVTTKATKTFDETGALFGITAGDELTTEAIKLTLPREAISAEYIALSAYVNAVMNTTQKFNLVVEDVTISTTSDDSADGTTQAMKISGSVEKNAPTYSVTIPESVALGTISRTEDTTVDFNVEVVANNFDGDEVKVVAASTGSLTSDSNSLAFTNDFGTQTASESKTLKGSIKVKAADAAAAKAGDYTGTTTFVISSETATAATAE